jgi:hypothetical protein
MQVEKSLKIRQANHAKYAFFVKGKVFIFEYRYNEQKTLFSQQTGVKRAGLNDCNHQGLYQSQFRTPPVSAEVAILAYRAK